MPPVKTIKVLRVDKHGRSHHVSSRHPKVYSESVLSTVQRSSELSLPRASNAASRTLNGSKPNDVGSDLSSNKNPSIPSQSTATDDASSTRPIDNERSERGKQYKVNDPKQKDPRRTRRRPKGICGPCSPCACWMAVLGLILLAIAFAALATYLGLSGKKPSSSAQTTSASTSTSTQTASTSTDTSTMTTFTTTTITTTTTDTDTTVTTTTDSTTTSETTTFVATSTSTSATTSTATMTTTTTAAPPCPPVYKGNATILWTTTSPTTTTYACQAYSWTSSVTGTVSLQFQLQHKPGRWYLDDVSVYHGGTQLLTNGGFESGSMSPWVRTTPNGPSCTGQIGDITGPSGSARTGSYFLWDGQINCFDQVAQSFNVVAGEIYALSFWLRSTSSSGSNIFAKILIS